MVNGKELSKVFMELAEPFPKEKIKIRDFDNKPYVEVDTLLERLNEVVGVQNYSDEYTTELMQVLDTFCIIATCTISIFDDEGKLVCKKSMTGGSNIAFPYIDKDKTQKATEVNSIPNDITSACQDAFKKVCTKRLGMASHQLKAVAKGEAYEFTVTAPARVLDSGHAIINGTVNGQKYSIFMFKQAVESNKATLTGLVAGQVIKVYGSEKTDKYGNPQITFKEFAEKPTLTSKTEPRTEPKPAVAKPNRAEPLEDIFKIVTNGSVTPLNQPGSFKIPSVYNSQECEVIIQKDMVAKMQQNGYWKPLEKNAEKGIELTFKGKLYDNGAKKQILLVDLAA